MRPEWQGKPLTNQVTLVTNDHDLVLKSIWEGMILIRVTKEHDATNDVFLSSRDECCGFACYLSTLTVNYICVSKMTRKLLSKLP